MEISTGDKSMNDTPAFAHVVFRTSQMQAMKQWYCDLLHARVIYEGHGLCFLSYDSEHHRVALLESDAPLERKAPNAAWMHHVAYTFRSLRDLVDRYDELSAKGIEPVNPVQHGVTTSLYYEDPDGNQVEMQIDNFDSADDATDYMRGPEFDADPIGPVFSPAAMAEAFKAGVPVPELTSRAWAIANPQARVPLR
jgi:catechol-2,3-dioxygenase